MTMNAKEQFPIRTNRGNYRKFISTTLLHSDFRSFAADTPRAPNVRLALHATLIIKEYDSTLFLSCFYNLRPHISYPFPYGFFIPFYSLQKGDLGRKTKAPQHSPHVGGVIFHAELFPYDFCDSL